MNAIAPITVRPIQRPNYMNAPVTLETFERWFIANYYAMRRYWLELQECTGAKETAGEFLEWAQCQYDIAKTSPEPQQPMPGIPALVEGSSPTAGIGTADAGSLTQLRIDQYRQSIYAYERLIEQLYDLLPNDIEAATKLVRGQYLEIHGEPR